MFQPLKSHYQGVKTFINENISNGCQWLTSLPSCFNPRKEPPYTYNEGRVGSRAGLDVFKKRKIFCPYQDLNPGPSSLTVKKKKNHPTTGIQGLQGE
jgi:hypothetical protein